ncbi:conserved exported hypothetical protein [Thiomonas sp. X19]|uniref:hypothetical protein n=1 Tax=Thiomonas sp. X19 TaxID=1050370 RepID=UPI000B6DB0AB|nr:hypothetical protein [Thiomonas sp. X19]SCC93578.1 conserved exported hypothetical protein [Thiomonas sp. X19]
MKPSLHTITIAAAVMAALSLSGCAGLVLPGADTMAKLPVVRFGEQAPTHKEYVLFLPANTPLPVDASVEGSLFEQGAKAPMTVTLKKGVYIYKRWISFDDKTWTPGQDVVAGKFLITIPGEKTGSNPGVMKAEFNLKSMQ